MSLRIEYSWAVDHVTSRGKARRKIFTNEQDRENFFFVLGYVVIRYNWLYHAYCLMDNHYHLLIEMPDANLSVGMRQLNGIYTQRYNRRHSKTGHVFQGRFKAIVVDKEHYLLELCRYVVLNPVRAKLVEEVKKWPWSSYQATAGLKTAPGYLMIDWILGMLSTKRKAAQKRYQRFVAEGKQLASPWEGLKGQVLLGEENFVEGLKDLLADKQQVKEIPRRQRYVSRPSLSTLFREGDKKDRRDMIIHDAHVKYGYTLKEIADHLQIHYTTVSKVFAARDRQ